MDKTAYINEGHKQLNNTQFYEPTDTDLTGKVTHRVNLHIHNMLQKGQISQRTCSYLTTDIYIEHSISTCYQRSIKIKKSTRKIYASDSGSPTEDFTICGSFHRNLSQSFIRDSTHLINMLNHISVQPGMPLCTLDVTNLILTFLTMKAFKPSKNCWQ